MSEVHTCSGHKSVTSSSSLVSFMSKNPQILYIVLKNILEHMGYLFPLSSSEHKVF